MSNRTEMLGTGEGERFKFGENWARLLPEISEESIVQAEQSLTRMLDVTNLEGKTFLDIGSGSGLFSLAARRLGARVHSFDFDWQSVACTNELKERFFPGDENWIVEQGSALDANFMGKLGKFDIVYSWGVLHHTGAMWLGIEMALQRLGREGTLFVAVYNDQGRWSHSWWLIKSIYNALPRYVNTAFAYSVWYSIALLNVVKHTLLLKPMTAIGPMMSYKPARGMNARRDIVDWIGGMPYEFVRFDVLVRYFEVRGLRLLRGERAEGHGCHQLVLRRGDHA